MKERFLHVVLTVFLSLMGLSASAYDFEADGLYYTITSTSDLTVSVSGLADPSRVELVIPNVVVYKSKSLLVTSIDEEAFANTNIESISVPSSVIKIGNKAFQECSNLKVVNLSEGISYLGSNCFSGCSHLSSIELPTTLKYVPSYTFSDCTELSQCILHENIKAIYESAFKNSGIEIINIPNSCDTIGTSAFADAANLKHVVLPSALRSISERCFSGCQKLQDLSLPQSICYINDYAFQKCN